MDLTEYINNLVENKNVEELDCLYLILRYSAEGHDVEHIDKIIKKIISVKLYPLKTYLDVKKKLEEFNFYEKGGYERREIGEKFCDIIKPYREELLKEKADIKFLSQYSKKLLFIILRALKTVRESIRLDDLLNIYKFLFLEKLEGKILKLTIDEF